VNFPIHILLIGSGFRCELEQFISVPAASIVPQCLINVLVSKRKGEINRKKNRPDVVSNSTHDKRYTILAHAVP